MKFLAEHLEGYIVSVVVLVITPIMTYVSGLTSMHCLPRIFSLQFGSESAEHEYFSIDILRNDLITYPLKPWRPVQALAQRDTATPEQK